MSRGLMQQPTGFSLANTAVADRSLASLFSGIATGILPSTNADSLADYQRPKPTRSTSVDPRIVPLTIPPTHTNRTLVLCFDGTGDQFDNDNSNIVKFVSLLKKDDNKKQMVYYQAGIGTYTSPTVANPPKAKVLQTLAAVIAWDLNAHVMDGYEFLMQNYAAGDKICIFGFSRGAHTARSLAGMIHKVGLLPAGNYEQVPFAYKMYTQDDKTGWKQSGRFKKTFSVDVDIEFVGVWDTVDSVGILPRRLPFTTSNTIVRTFRHAVSLDERRAKFKPKLWHLTTNEGVESSIPLMAVTASPMLSAEDKAEKEHKRMNEQEEEQRMLEEVYSEKEAPLTDAEEVWFSGCHCDVGGGSVSNKTHHSLARIPLRWMVRECFKTNTGIMFDARGLRDLGLDPSTLHPFVTPRPPPLPVGNATVETLKSPSKLRRFLSLVNIKKSSVSGIPSCSPDAHSGMAQVGTEEAEDLKDALSPMYDRLRLRPAWWILEILPFTQQGDMRPNLARPRYIPDEHCDSVKIHRTVKTRMEAKYPEGYPKSKRYSPKACTKLEPTWVE